MRRARGRGDARETRGHDERAMERGETARGGHRGTWTRAGVWGRRRARAGDVAVVRRYKSARAERVGR